MKKSKGVRKKAKNTKLVTAPLTWCDSMEGGEGVKGEGEKRRGERKGVRCQMPENSHLKPKRIWGVKKEKNENKKQNIGSIVGNSSSAVLDVLSGFTCNGDCH